MNDFRIALRMLRKNPSYAAVGVLTLALGIGATTAIFSVLNAVVLRPLPYRESDRLVLIRDSAPPRLPEFSVSPGRFLEYQKRSRAFDAMAALGSESANLTGVGDPVRLRGYRISATAFPMLGVAPLVGRTFTEEEDRVGADAEVILSEHAWRALFAGKTALVGRTIVLDDKPRTVIGVMPAAFTFPNDQADYWRPMAFTADEQTRYGSHYLMAVARLKPGVTADAAGADLARVSREIESLPGNKDWTTLVFSYLAYTVRGVRAGLLVLAGAVGVVLLIACANVANLLLARGLGRERELAVRAALGASRARLLRQMLTENLVLGLTGAVAGLAVASMLLRVVTTSTSFTLPRLQTVRLDGPTVGCAVVLAVVAPMLFGLLPAVQISRARLRDVLAHGGRGGAHALRTRTRSALIVGEVALAVVLVAGSTLLLRSFERLTSVSSGFDAAHALLVPISLPDGHYPDDGHREAFWNTLLERLSRAPGVEAVGLTQSVPFVSDFVTSIEVPGVTSTDEAAEPTANFYAVSPDYFRAMGIRLLRGRVFTASDNSLSHRVAIVSQTLAERYFGSTDPLSKHVTLHQGPSTDPSEIVGVVGDIKQYGLDATTTLQVYEPSQQHRYFSGFTLVARSSADPNGLTATIRGVLREVDATLPMAAPRTLESYVDASTGSRRFTTTLLGGFAGVALLLAAVGVYGLVSFAVALRTQEIGIRMALGARRAAVLRLVLWQGLGLTGIGVLVGAVATLWASQALQAQLFEASIGDSVAAMTAAPVALLVAAALACYVPARRAVRVAPVMALREG